MLLKKGDQGEHVKLIQQILGLKVDGDFGPVTEKAVKNYQKENNLTVDGVVGNQTWSSMLKEKEDCYSREEIENAVAFCMAVNFSSALTTFSSLQVLFPLFTSAKIITSSLFVVPHPSRKILFNVSSSKLQSLIKNLTISL